MKVCVIGAGVLGLTAAYEISCRGHEVLLLDREGVFAGASSRSFAWLNSNNKPPAAYHRLNVLGVEQHRRLQQELGAAGEWLHLTGGILADFSASRQETYAARMTAARHLDYPVETIDRNHLQQLEPEVLWPDDLEQALYFPLEGYLDNDILSEVLLAALWARGVETRRAAAIRVDSHDAAARVTCSDGRVIEADRVVVAAGADSRRITLGSGYVIPVAELGTPTIRTHGLLGLTEAVALGPHRVIVSDRINVRPCHEGRIWVQAPAVEQRVEEGESPALLSEVGAVMEAELARLFGQPVPIDKVIFSGRSLPEDGLSIVGFVDEFEKIYCLATHSGMTLAALLGKLAAEELEGHPSALLADFRPARFDHETGRADEACFIGRQ